MTVREEALQQLELYLQCFPGEAARVAALRLQLQEDEADPLSRTNMRGHVTTSALVLDASLTHTLMIEHRVLRRWLQPGGHYEAGQSLWESALREVVEETGVHELAAHPVFGRAIPLDIDSHPIPANPKKGEGAHWHHDYAYLVIAPRDESALVAQLEEVSGVAWRPVAELCAESEEARFRGLLEKLKGLELSPSSP